MTRVGDITRNHLTLCLKRKYNIITITINQKIKKITKGKNSCTTQELSRI